MIFREVEVNKARPKLIPMGKHPTTQAHNLDRRTPPQSLQVCSSSTINNISHLQVNLVRCCNLFSSLLFSHFNRFFASISITMAGESLVVASIYTRRILLRCNANFIPAKRVLTCSIFYPDFAAIARTSSLESLSRLSTLEIFATFSVPDLTPLQNSLLISTTRPSMRTEQTLPRST